MSSAKGDEMASTKGLVTRDEDALDRQESRGTENKKAKVTSSYFEKGGGQKPTSASSSGTVSVSAGEVSSSLHGVGDNHEHHEGPGGQGQVETEATAVPGAVAVRGYNAERRTYRNTSVSSSHRPLSRVHLAAEEGGTAGSEGAPSLDDFGEPPSIVTATVLDEIPFVAATPLGDQEINDHWKAEIRNEVEAEEEQKRARNCRLMELLFFGTGVAVLLSIAVTIPLIVGGNDDNAPSIDEIKDLSQFRGLNCVPSDPLGCVSDYEGLVSSIRRGEHSVSRTTKGYTVALCPGSSIGVEEEILVTIDHFTLCCPVGETCALRNEGKSRWTLRVRGVSAYLLGIQFHVNENIEQNYDHPTEFYRGNVHIHGRGHHHVISSSFVGGMANGIEGIVGGNLGVDGFSSANVTVTESSFVGGNADAGWGGGLAVSNVQVLSLSNSTFTNNTALHGGGLAAHLVRNFTARGTHFNDNEARGTGGAGHIATGREDILDFKGLTGRNSANKCKAFYQARTDVCLDIHGEADPVG